MLGITCGVLGVFLLLRRRALLGDALSHATLPGIACAYLLMQALYGEGKNLIGLLLGATTSAVVGMGALLVLRRYSKLREDTIIALVLSTFFGLGVALLGIIQKSPRGHAAGLQHFIYGDTATILRSDLLVMALISLVILIAILALFKEIRIVTFDHDYAASLGYQPLHIDTVIILMTILITVVGLQAVGLILITALLIVPAVAARFWVYGLRKMCLLAALFGAVSCYCGVLLSATIAKLPAGASVVLASGAVLAISALLGKNRGLIHGAVRNVYRQRALTLRHLFLALRHHYNLEELTNTTSLSSYLEDHAPITHHWLANQMRLPELAVIRITALAHRARLLKRMDYKAYRLTEIGSAKMIEAVRNHELSHAFLTLYPQRIYDLYRDDDEFLIEKIIPPEDLQSVYDLVSNEQGYLLKGVAIHAAPHNRENTNGLDGF